jgi:hypothetical protein
MLNINRTSNSLDTLKLEHREDGVCVRKTFRFDLTRAQANVQKQKLFRPLNLGAVRIASVEVLDFQIKSDSAELLMPYVEGISGDMFPLRATRNIGKVLNDSLSLLLTSEMAESQEKPIHVSLFKNKLKAVISATKDSDLKKILKLCTEVVESLQTDLRFPIGPCHGDLTLVNIILNPVSGVALIDFLHTFLETPLQDIAKLKQDFDYGWSFRRCSPSVKIKGEIFCRHHYPRAVTEIERMYPVQVKILTLMALSRISPYVRDGNTKLWLIDSIKQCIENFHK